MPCLRARRPPNALHRTRLWPWWHPKHQHLAERPHVIAQAGRPRWRTRPPPLGRATAVGRFRNRQRLAHACVWQHDVVVAMEHRQLMLPAVCALTQRVAPTAYRRHTLAHVQVEALHEGRIALPAPRRSALCNGPPCAEHHPVFHPHQALAPVLLDHRRIEQPRQRHPAWLGLGPLSWRHAVSTVSCSHNSHSAPFSLGL